MRALAVTSLLAMPLVIWPSYAYADDEAVTRFERGVQLYEAENFEGALVEFKAAYKLSKNYKLLYNIGICQNALKDYPAATDSFQKYLAEGGSEVSEARRADVSDRLSKLALMVTRVRISTDAPAGATLLIDDQPAGTAPFNEPVVAKVGRRQFSITSQGRTVTKTIEIGSGDQNASVILMLADLPANGGGGGDKGGDKRPVTPTDDDGPSFPWPFWGLTALIGGGAAVTGILAVQKRNDFETTQATFGVDKPTLEDQRSEAHTLGLVTDVLLACTVVSAGFSTYLTIRYFGKKKQNTGITILPMGIGYTRSF